MSITRWVITLCVVTVSLSAGCRDKIQEPTQSEPPPIVVYESGIEAEGLTRDTAHREVRAAIRSDGRRRWVTLRRVTTTPLGPAMHAEITDDHGNFRYAIELASDAARGRVWCRERTAADVVTTMVTRSAGRVVEEYDINGDVLAVEYAVSDEPALDRPAENPADLKQPDAAPALSAAFAKLAEFEAFCAPHMENTLRDNRDGELLLALLSEPDFAHFVTGAIEGPQRVKDPVKRACWAAFTCVNVMCRFGGLSNPVCVACGGVASACIITEIACWFANCDCCF